MQLSSECRRKLRRMGWIGLNCSGSGRQHWGHSPPAWVCAVVCPIWAVLEPDEFNWCGDNELDQPGVALARSVVPGSWCWTWLCLPWSCLSEVWHGGIVPVPSLPLLPATFLEISVLQIAGSQNLASESVLVIAQRLDPDVWHWGQALTQSL